MLYRQTYLEKDRRMADAGEYTVDLTPLDPITMLWIKFQCLNGGTYNQNNTLAENITAIEILDGADVLFSLDGPQAIAQCAFDAKRMGQSIINGVNGESQTALFPIHFGRKFGDKELALDPTKFTNPQLRVRWNMATVNAVGATGFLTNRVDLSVVANLIVGGPSPRGLLCSKQIYTYTTAAAGTEYIDMPRNEVWRRLLLRGKKAASRWHWDYDRVKLTFDGDQFVPIDANGWDMVNQQAVNFPQFKYHHRMRHAADIELQCVLREEEVMSFVHSNIRDTVAQYSCAGNGEGLLALETGGAAAGAGDYDMEICGYNPYDCLAIPFGDPDVIDDWLPASTFNNARLEVRAGVADASNYIVLQTLRTY